MALIHCPECGRDNVSDTAVSCPGCGYNIQAHMKKKQKEELLQAKNERLQQQEKIKQQLIDERRNDPNYKKRQIAMVCTVCTVILLIICVIVFGSKFRIEKAYEKDLSSVFGITPDMNMEDIIEFEASHYGHTEYNMEQVQDGKLTRLEFAPYTKSGSDIDYKHYYFFYTDTETLKDATYFDILGVGNKDNDAKCEHINIIKNAALSISPNWDKSERDGLFLTMYGNIDGIKCRVRYETGSAKGISLFIDRAE